MELDRATSVNDRDATRNGMLTSNAKRHTMSNCLQRWCWMGLIVALCVLTIGVSNLAGQTNGLDQDEPIKLFERGQNAPAKNDLKTAIEFYDAAIRLKPEFPEAEFQRALALLFSKRKDEALQGFSRAVELRPDWAFAYARFGSQLSTSLNDPRNGEPILRKAIELDPDNEEELVALADV